MVALCPARSSEIESAGQPQSALPLDGDHQHGDQTGDGERQGHKACTQKELTVAGIKHGTLLRRGTNAYNGPHIRPALVVVRGGQGSRGEP
jgi:hypothetical protein